MDILNNPESAVGDINIDTQAGARAKGWSGLEAVRSLNHKEAWTYTAKSNG